MRREDRFVMSHKPYAVDLSTLRGDEEPRANGGTFFSGRINAVWFRRQRRSGWGRDGAMVTVACIGTLWDLQDGRPVDGREFLERHDDGRYGGHCDGRWDGSGYWGAEEPDVQAKHLDLLRPMLDGYTQDPKNPPLPAPFEGWWTFQ